MANINKYKQFGKIWIPKIIEISRQNNSHLRIYEFNFPF